MAKAIFYLFILGIMSLFEMLISIFKTIFCETKEFFLKLNHKKVKKYVDKYGRNVTVTFNFGILINLIFWLIILILLSNI